MARIMTKPARRGLALLETALVFPILLLLTLGLVEYGWMFLQAQKVANAARHGARLVVRPDITNAEATAAVDTYMSSVGLGGSGYVLTFSADTTSLIPGDTMTVDVTVSYANIDLGMPLVPVPTNLAHSVSMVKEGP